MPFVTAKTIVLVEELPGWELKVRDHVVPEGRPDSTNDTLYVGSGAVPFWNGMKPLPPWRPWLEEDAGAFNPGSYVFIATSSPESEEITISKAMKIAR